MENGKILYITINLFKFVHSFLSKKVRENKEYNINIYDLKNGIHNFSFKYKNELFSINKYSLVEKGNGVCNIELEKSQSFIILNFKIKGSVGLICDRSLEEFDYSINLENKLILKYGEAFDDEDYEVWIIPATTPIFNVERNIFEFINTAIPMKKLHPKFKDEELSDEITLVYSSEPKKTAKSEEEILDPRWEILKDLKKE